MVDVGQQAEQLASHYNPHQLVPFPFEAILADNQDLRVAFVDDIPEISSGVIGYSVKTKDFLAIVNNNLTSEWQNYTLAKLVGHYFLHQKLLVKQKTFISRLDFYSLNEKYMLKSKTELEASIFGVNLLLPTNAVTKAWKIFPNLEELAKIFQLSSVIVALRLKHLQLID